MAIKAVVFDWAGTMVDHGSRAPTRAFVEVLSRFQVPITDAQARGPMGRPKWDHIKELLADPDVSARWRAAHGTEPSDRDVDRVYEVFVPLNAAMVTDFADLIPGVLDVIKVLRSQGIKIGSTTGYTREIMDRLLPEVAKAGLVTDNVVCAGDLTSGRPGPMMMYKCFLDLDVWPASSVVKVDDTDVGIAEGLTAGCWTVGVALTGNATGLSRDELAALSPKMLAEHRARATDQLRRCGAHYVIDSVADLESVIASIDGRLARGERPRLP
jgi:phosphonoacetaldehyde hydrolase